MTEIPTLRIGMRVRNNKEGRANSRVMRIESFYVDSRHNDGAVLRGADGHVLRVALAHIHADGIFRKTGWDVHPADMPKATPKNALAEIPDAALRAELHRRDEARSAALHADRLKRATYLCPDCGAPDSSHYVDCRSDTDCT